MPYLLDTQAALYFLSGDRRLTRQARQVIDDLSSEKYFSLASMWEIAIKLSIGKLELNAEFEAVPLHLSKWNVRELSIQLRHLNQVSLLPQHHRDPFDRLLVAQCLVDNLTLVSGDSQLDAYGVQRVW